MPIEFRCSQCGKLLRTPDDTSGRQAQCPLCGKISIVPAVSEPPEPAVATFVSPEGAAPTGAPLGPQDTPAILEATASARVIGPATALMIVGGMALVFSALAAVFWLLWVMMMASNEPLPAGIAMHGLTRADALRSGILYLAVSTVWIVLAGLILAGAVRMKSLRNYGLARIAAVIAVIPCVAPCCLLTIPFGIWALIVLADSSVKAAFRR